MGELGRRTAAALLILWLAIGSCGCSKPPQFPAAAQVLIEGLRTAISAQNHTWVAEGAKRIDDLHKQGKLSDEQFETLQRVIDATKADDWKSANKQIILVEKAQRPQK